MRRQLASIADLDAYHQDMTASLKIFFSSVNPGFDVRFSGYRQSEVNDQLFERLGETDLRSSLATLARVEAAFRIDYQERGRRKDADAVSKSFRKLYKKHGQRVSFEDDILGAWRVAHPQTASVIGELRGAFKFRHWLAHGMYWQPNLGRRYTYDWIYTLADSVLLDFPLFGVS